MIEALARALEQAAMRAGRRRTSPAALEAVFARALRDRDFREGLKYLEHDVANRQDIEHFVSVREGQPQARVAGTVNSLKLPERIDAGERVSWMHNHPEDWSSLGLALYGGKQYPLSFNDIAVTANYPGGYGARGFKQALALISRGDKVLREGSSARLTKRGRKHLRITDRNVRLLNRIVDLDNDLDRAGVGARKVPGLEALNRALGRLGLIEYGSRYGVDNQLGMAKQAEWMRQFEDDNVRALHPHVFMNLPYPFRPSHLALGAGIGAGGLGLLAANGQRRRAQSSTP